MFTLIDPDYIAVWCYTSAVSLATVVYLTKYSNIAGLYSNFILQQTNFQGDMLNTFTLHLGVCPALHIMRYKIQHS